MGCKGCCTTKCVSLTLATFSTIFLLLCGLQLYLSIRLKNYEIWNDKPDNTMPEFDQKNVDKGQTFKNGLFYGTIVLGGVNILIAMIGMCAAIKKGGKVSLIAFCVISFLSTIATIGLALGVLVITVGGRNYLENTCSYKPLTNIQSKINNYMLNYWPYLDTTTNNLINTHMCTDICPCAKIDEQQWASTLYNQETPGGQVTNLNFNGTITNFNQCYQQLVSKNLTQPLSQNTLDMIHHYEMERECIGLCSTPRFNFYHDLSSGPPKQTCMSFVKNQMMKSLGSLSLVLFIAGGIIFLGFCVQFGLWSRKVCNRRKRSPQQPQSFRKYNKSIDSRAVGRKINQSAYSDITES